MSEEKKKRPNATVGVMIFKDGEILLGKRKEIATHGRGEYSFPGGHIENGESFREAIERETKEEAGKELKIKNLKFQCVANITIYNKANIGFLADWESGNPASDSNENIGEWGWFNLNNLPEPLFYPTKLIIDSYKTGKIFYDKE